MNSRFKIFIAIAFGSCMLLSYVSAQCPDSTELNITASLYSQENGLASNMLVGFATDSVGFRYFLGIDGKWIRYDGVNFNVCHEEKNTIIHRPGYTDGSDGNYKVQYINNIS